MTGLIEASKGTAFTWLYSSYYRKLERERVDAACAELYTKRINAAQWCEQVQKSADEFAQDPAVKKYKRA
nr:hypothetical protein GCM10020092_071230 [Actinoplanes digitatis]